MKDHGAEQGRALGQVRPQLVDMQRRDSEKSIMTDHLAARARLMRPTLESIAHANAASGSAGYLQQNPHFGK